MIKNFIAIVIFLVFVTPHNNLIAGTPLDNNSNTLITLTDTEPEPCCFLHLDKGCEAQTDAGCLPNNLTEVGLQSKCQHNGWTSCTSHSNPLRMLMGGTWEYIHNGNNCSSLGSSGSCPQGRHEASYVQVGDKFYLLGGRENDSNVNIYDPANNSWTIGADAPISLHHFQAVEYHGLLLVVGAMTGNFPNEDPVDRIIIYDPAKDQWLDGPTIPENRRRGAAGVVVHNDKIYIVCGIQDGHRSGWVPWLDEYDPATDTWRVLPDAPHSRDHFHAAVADGKIYAGGGRRSGQDGTFNATEGAIDIYNLESGSWSTNSRDIPTQRAGGTVAVIGNEVIYIGGEKNSGSANDETEALNVNNGTWRTLTPLNRGRHGTQAIVNNENIWIASGSPNRGGGRLQSQERFYFDNRNDPILSSTSESALSAPETVSINNTGTITVNNTNGSKAILVEDISMNNNNFQLESPRDLPFLVRPGESFTLQVSHSGNTNQTGQIRIRHTGSNGTTDINLNSEAIAIKIFNPDPNKEYYIDAPHWNTRLAATGESEDPFMTSIDETGANVEWKFVAKGNGFWHVQRAAGGSKPRLRTDNSVLADMQPTTSSGTFTYYELTESNAINNTYFFTLPDGPTNFKRLQIDPDANINFVTSSNNGRWESLRITEVPETTAPPITTTPTTPTTVNENIAPEGSPSQSSTAHEGVATRAIDRNTSGNWNNQSITHTNNELRPWWQVDWTEDKRIDEIVLYNRTNCCSDRLTDFTVSILASNGSTVFSQTYSDSPNPSLSISSGGIVGRTVRVQLNGTNPLSLAEVEVYGSTANTTGGGTTPTGSGGGGGTSIDSASDDCSVVDFEDYKNGFGIWNDGGADSDLLSWPGDATNGAIRLRDNDGAVSSTFTDNLNLSGSNSVLVSFDYHAVSMESGEDFLLEYSVNQGSSWVAAQAWVSGVDFNNDQTNSESVSIEGSFNNQTRIRFRCDASGTGDFVYIDNVLIEDCSDNDGGSNSCTGTISNISLNPQGGAPLIDLNQGAIFCGADFAGSGVRIRADVTGNHDSATFIISTPSGSPVTNVENFLPYDSPEFSATEAGTYTINVQLYSGPNLTGTMCDQLTISFEIEAAADCDIAGDCFDEFNFQDFESGLGIWNDGGSDCSLRNNSGDGFNGSDGFVRLRDNSGVASSMFTDVLPFGNVNEVRVDFRYFPSSFETNEDFFLEYSNDGGDSWTLVQSWVVGVDFINEFQYYNESVAIDGSFSNDTRIRFRCDASGNADIVFIDNVRISVCGSANVIDDSKSHSMRSSQNNGVIGKDTSSDELNESEIGLREVEPKEGINVKVYPNPVSSINGFRLNMELANLIAPEVKIEIFDITGHRMLTHVLDFKSSAARELNLSDLDDGIFIIKITTADNAAYFEKIMIEKN